MKKTLTALFLAISLPSPAEGLRLSPYPCVVEQGFLYEEAAFPSCHATTVVQLPTGEMMAAFFGGTYEGHPDCCIWTSRYNASSKRWSAPSLLADGIYTAATRRAFDYDADFESLCHRDSIFAHTTWTAPAPHSGKPTISPLVRKPCYNPVLYCLQDGTVVLDYKIGKWVQDWTAWEIRSKDNGQTWSRPRPLAADTTRRFTQLGPVKNKPELTPSGRIIAGSSTETGGRWKFHFETSDDAGKSWQMVEVDCDTIECIQPSILYLNGRDDEMHLKAIGRTRHGRLAETSSIDGGHSWTRVELSSMPNNNSGTDALTLSDGRHILVYNDSRCEGVRTPLSVAISTDATHWTKIADLETDHEGEYSYPCVVEASDGRLWILYTWRRQRPAYAVIDLSRLPENLLKD